MGAAIDVCCEIEDGHRHKEYYDFYSSHQDRKEHPSLRRFHDLEAHQDRQAGNCMKLVQACPYHMCDTRVWERDPEDFKDPAKLKGEVEPHTLIDLSGDGKVSKKEIVGAVYMSYPKLLANIKEFVPGDPVIVRDHIWENWKPGVVDSLNPIKVILDGTSFAWRYKFVKSASAAKAINSAQSRLDWFENLLRGAGEILNLHTEADRLRGSDLRNFRARSAHLMHLRNSPNSPFVSPRFTMWPSPRADAKWGEEASDDSDDEEEEEEEVEEQQQTQDGSPGSLNGSPVPGNRRFSIGRSRRMSAKGDKAMRRASLADA